MTKNRDPFHCPVCDAKFDLEVELQHHARIRHIQQDVSGVAASKDNPPTDEREFSTRKNKEFTRRHME